MSDWSQEAYDRSVREPLTRDEFFDLDMQVPTGPGSGAREFAEHLVQWAASPHPDSELTPARLLTFAGERFDMLGDQETAEQCLTRALAAGDWGEGLDPRCFLISLCLDQDRMEEALEHDGTLRRSRPDDVQTYAFMGDQWWDHGDLGRALGWLNRGLDYSERTGSAGEGQILMLCQTRWHVRKAQGQEPDAYDQRAISAAQRLFPG